MPEEDAELQDILSAVQGALLCQQILRVKRHQTAGGTSGALCRG